MNVLLDTNVVLDVLLARLPHANASAAVMALVEQAKVKGFVCATTVTTLDYLLSQALPSTVARGHLRRLLGLFEVAPVTRSILEEALESRVPDFEDAVLEQAARLVRAEAIVTRNIRDFRHAAVKVLTPDEFLAGIR